jgi:glycerol-3-phosphate acyltransferase PlsX
MFARKALQELKNTVDPNEIPGAPLLGVNGVVIIIHGSSSARGVENGILGARINFENRLLDHIRENIDELRAVERELTQRAAGAEG